MSLSRKQTSKNEAWVEALARIEEEVTKADLDALTGKTVAEIRETVNGKKAAYCWSGGKDSIVLGKICELAGVTDSMIGVCDLEYPAFMAWIQEHKPAGCEVINTHQDLDWLSKHPEMLFPRESATASRWFSIVQHRAQRLHAKNQNVDILILGRRKADGNYVGKGSNIYTDGKGVTRYSPLANWRHEDILAFIHYNEMSMPPIYDWPNGYVYGTHPWPARRGAEDEAEVWAEINSIDPQIVVTAAEKIPGAKRFLEGVTA